jgi:hypothetical protein
MKIVKMSLTETTINTINSLFCFFETENKTLVVSRSIRLANFIAKEIMNGNKILVELPNGKTKQLIFK